MNRNILDDDKPKRDLDNNMPAGLFLEKDRKEAGNHDRLSVEVWVSNGKGKLLLFRDFDCWSCLECSAEDFETPEDAAIEIIRRKLQFDVSAADLLECGRENSDQSTVVVYALRFDQQVQEVQEFTNAKIQFKWFSLQEFERVKENNVEYSVLLSFEKYFREILYWQIAEAKPCSIKRLVAMKPKLVIPKRGLPDVGARPDNSEFFPDANRLKALNEQSIMLTPMDHRSFHNELGGGDPMKTGPFPGIEEAISKLLESDILSQYPTPEGDKKIRERVLGYLAQEGFSKHLTDQNIIFTNSTTHAFNLLCKLLLRQYDVVLFEAPTYGLFTFAPEREGGITRFYPLRENEHWRMEPECLARTIDRINSELAEKYHSKVDYAPKVVMVYQSNPQNPIGRVISKENKEYQRSIVSVCREKGVFYVEDLIYKDLSYEKDVFPAMGIEGYESDVITLMGASKAYGLAGIRTGMIVADEVIIRGIRDLISQTIDSPPHLQAAVLGEIFNNSEERNKKYSTYFAPIIAEYRYRFFLLKAGVDGLDTIHSSKIRLSISKEIENYYHDKIMEKLWLKGVPGISIAKGTEPESGFFALADLTALIGKRFGSEVLLTEEDILLYLYKRKSIKYLPGSYMAWPDPSRVVARISFAVERRDIIFFAQCLREAVALLSD